MICWICLTRDETGWLVLAMCDFVTKVTLSVVIR
jgi:hypothetical protein